MDFRLNDLSDFEKLASQGLGLSQRKGLFSHPLFFESPLETPEGTHQHSDFVDQILGLEVKAIEERLLKKAIEHNPHGSHKTWGQAIHQGNQTWVGLAPQTLLTPYSELKLMTEILKPKAQDLVVDLGAGYGRMGIILKAISPGSKFLGFEYVPERVQEGARVLNEFGCMDSELCCQDLTAQDFALPEADFYFLYDYGTVAHIRHTLKQIESMADKKNFKLIARGKGSRSLIQYEHPWLSQVHTPYHAENFSIYSTSDG